MVALLRLVDWHTPDAQLAIQAVRFDRDSHMFKAAEKAPEVFPGNWKSPYVVNLPPARKPSKGTRPFLFVHPDGRCELHNP